MSKKAILWGQAAVVLVLLCSLESGKAEEAADECLSEPNGSSPAGSHWYYRVERGTQRHCWYLGSEGGNVRQAQPRRSTAQQASKRQAHAPKPAPQQEDDKTSSAPRSTSASSATTMTTSAPATAARNSSAANAGTAVSGAAAADPASPPTALSAQLLAPRPLLQLSDSLSSGAPAASTEADPSGRAGRNGAPERPNIATSNDGEDQNTTDLEEEEEMPLVWPVMAAGDLNGGETHQPAARSSGALPFIIGSLAASFGGMMLWALYLTFAKVSPRRRADREWPGNEASYRQRPAHQSRAAVRTSIGRAILPATPGAEIPEPYWGRGAESIARQRPGGFQTASRRPHSTTAEEFVGAARLARGKPAEASAPVLRRRSPSLDPSEEPLRLPEWMSAKRPQSSRV
jgi:hypothetical protein